MNRSLHRSNFVKVNGINLHYQDWGGNGDVLLFLAGLGCNAHIFGNLAPRFTDKFHVMALTRRGHGESDHPDTGYDIDTLTEDICQFLDTLGIERVILAGHSMAGVELSHFSALYPDRVIKLIFLDAAYDRSSASYRAMLDKNPLIKIQPPGLDVDYYSEEEYFAATKRAYSALKAIWTEPMQEQSQYEISKTPEGKIVDRMSDTISTALTNTLKSYIPEDAQIQAPMLSFFAVSNERYYLDNDWMTEAQKAQVKHFFETELYSWLQENIEQFRRNVPHARVIEIPQGNHYCFIKKEDLVYEEMRKFLLN